jgi:hypothetical protein
MRATILILSTGLILGGAAPAWATRPALHRLPSATAPATPGTGSAPILSAGIAGAPAITAFARRKPARRSRGARIGVAGPL